MPDPLKPPLVIATTALRPGSRQCEDWLRWLPPERRARIAACSDAEARTRSLLGIGLLLEGLRRFGYREDVLAGLRVAAGGKPQLAVPVSFSLSHCDGCVVCALCLREAIGVDVEALGDSHAQQFPHYLSAAERRWAGTAPARFYALWTRKEAIVKASGEGLRRLPEVRLDPATGEGWLDGHRWHTTPLSLGAGRVGALAGAEPWGRVAVEFLDPAAPCGV